MDKEDSVTDGGSVRIGRDENFRLFGIGSGNILSEFAELDELISSLAQEAVNRNVLNALTNPIDDITPQNLTPIFSIFPINRVTSSEDYNFVLSILADDNILLSAEVAELPQIGEVTFYWYDYYNRDDLIGNGKSIYVGKGENNINMPGTYVFYVEAIHTIRNIYRSISSPQGKGKRVSVTFNVMYDVVFAFDDEGETSKDSTEDNAKAEIENIVIPAGGTIEGNYEETKVALQITAYNDDRLPPLKVKAVGIDDDTQDIIFNYLWYTVATDDLVVEGNEFNIDTSVTGEFDFYVLAISESIEIRREVKIIVNNRPIEPETPIVTIRQNPDSSSRIVVGDSAVILSAETQLDSKNNDEVQLTYQWYRDGRLLTGETGRELNVPNNEAGIHLFRVEVMNEDSRSETELHEAFGSSEHFLTINQVGKDSVQEFVNFTGISVELERNQIEKIEKFFKENEKIITARKIVRIQVINTSSRDDSMLAFDRREEVYRVVREILQTLEIENNLLQGHLGWGGTGSGSSVTVWVEIEY